MIARRLGSGMTVLLADFNEENMNQLASRLSGDGFKAETQVVDVSDRDSMRSLAKRAGELGTVTMAAHTADCPRRWRRPTRFCGSTS